MTELHSQITVNEKQWVEYDENVQRFTKEVEYADAHQRAVGDGTTKRVTRMAGFEDELEEHRSFREIYQEIVK